ncbi:MAG: cytochrome C oxidase Cbb3 [Raoultibacter sp.]
MLSTWDNIRRLYQEFMLLHKGSILHVLKCALTIAVLALLLEVFVFNFNYFTSAGYNTVNLSNRLTLQETVDEEYKVTSVNHVLEFSNLNAEVHNIRLDFSWAQPAQNLDVKINFTDAAHLTYFDSTEYTVGVPITQVSTNCDQSEYINLNTSGLTNNLRIEIAGKNVSYPIKLTGVYINAHHPFDFNIARFFVVVAAFALVYIFRPRSSIYRCYIVEHSRKSKAGIIATVVVEVYLLTTFLLMGSNLVGVATPTYNPGSWNKTGIVNTFEVGGDNAQQYAELAKSMADGRLYLEEDPPLWLQDMPDPYDKGARDEAQKSTGEKYLFDVAYYEGHYYVYFGVVPVLLFYLPFYLATGASFPTAIGVLIAAIAFVLGCSALLDRFARYHFKRVSLGLYLLLQIPLIFCCGILYLLKFPTFYSLPIMLGLAFSVWGLYFWMRGRAGHASAAGWYLAGSLCMALVIGCRPQLVLLSFLAFPLFWRLFITEKHLLTKRGALEFACLIGPYAIVIAGLCWYNKARFGSLFDFGANYNLTVNDMTKRGWNMGRLAPALFAYFIQPPNVTGVFPYIHPTMFETTYMGQTIKEVTFGGVFACLPFLWVLPFAKRVLSLRIRQRSTRTIAGVIIVLITAGLLVGLLDAQMAGILQRYFADFSFMFLTAAVLLVFIVNENLDPDTATHYLLMKVLIVLVTISMLYSLLLCVVPETGWFSDVYPWAYQSIVEAFQFWT